MKYLIIALSFLYFTSCSTEDPLTITQCIDDEISVFFPQACEGSGDLTKWIFNGQDVFCFNQGTCIADGIALIYDGECNLICTLGGVDGNEICDGLNWSDNAEFVGVVFRY
ncbi:MAG: hypothetical protein HKO66_01255 [Saprospiraceae bacterium]|nr:hypothetical protein [Bacteroidia bacterium]NNE14316.1 hypothetical protein [Saprospiraceae bacterium]NNL90836.1 hypothetical protein [Saprospiraceae bacterium]